MLRFIALQGVRAHKNLVHSSHLEQRIFRASLGIKSHGARERFINLYIRGTLKTRVKDRSHEVSSFITIGKQTDRAK